MELPKRLWFQGQLYVRVAYAPPEHDLIKGKLWWNDDEESYVEPGKSKELYDSLVRASRQTGHRPDPKKTAMHKKVVQMAIKVQDFLVVEGFDSIAKDIASIITRHGLWAKGYEVE